MKHMDTNYTADNNEDNECIFTYENEYICKDDNSINCLSLTDKEVKYLLSLLLEKYNVASRNELFHKLTVDTELTSIKNKVLNMYILGGSL